MLLLPDVDLICIDGRTDDKALKLSLNALKYSCKDIKFNNVQFVATKNLTDNPFQFSEIEPLKSMPIYSEFIIKKLKNYVTAPCVILVQWDGFILKPELWDNKFFEYDYIGAPWPPHWQQIDGRKYRVGNGGFSFRSRKLIDTVSFMDFDSSKEKVEDNFICLENRELLESLGIQFAPPEIAAKFSWENPIPETTPDNTFGFHGRHPMVQKYLQLLNE